MSIANFYLQQFVTSRFGDPRDGGARTHEGVDFSHSSAPGTIGVGAMRAGKVVDKNKSSGYGNYIVIRSKLDDGNEWDILYAHGHYYPSQKIGQTVSEGEIILHEGVTGWVTGSNVHIEQKRVSNGYKTDPEPEAIKCSIRRQMYEGKPPSFPLRKGWYYGPISGPAYSVSGYYGNGWGLELWQQRANYLGYSIRVDGLYGEETLETAKAIQINRNLAVDGLIGQDTWNSTFMG